MVHKLLNEIQRKLTDTDVWKATNSHLSAATCVYEVCLSGAGGRNVHSLSVDVRCLFKCKPITRIAALSQ